MSRFGVVASGFSAPYGLYNRPIRPSGQVDSVAALAARLNEVWVPDTGDRFNQIVDCLMNADTAYARPECADAMLFTERHARIYTDQNGNSALVGNPLVAGDPWLPFGVWLQRHWYRELPAYHAVPYLETQTWTLPANADGSPPAGTTPLTHPPTAASAPPPAPVTPAPPTPGTHVYTIIQGTEAECSALYDQYVAAQPAGTERVTMLAGFRTLHPQCADWAAAQPAVSQTTAASTAAGWSTTKKIAVVGGVAAAAGLVYFFVTAAAKRPA